MRNLRHLMLDVRTLVVGILLSILVVGLLSIYFATRAPLTANGFRLELTKVSLQVVAVGVVGSIASLAVFMFQEHARRQAETERRSRDERARLDDLRRNTLELMVRAYNKIKGIRRHIRSELVGDDQLLDVAAYQQHMAELIEQQLSFEELKRLSQLLHDDAVRVNLREIERHVGKVTTEFEDTYQQVRSGDLPCTLGQLTHLAEFLDGPTFHRRVATPLNIVSELLYESLLQPFIPPRRDAVSFRASRHTRSI